MSKNILEIVNLQISVEEKVVLRDFNLHVEAGQVVALSGPNGSGKSSVAMTLLGNSNYKISNSSQIKYLGQNLDALSIDERAKAGIYVAWQNPMVIPGVRIFNFCKNIVRQTGSLVEFKKQLESLLEKVGLPKEYLDRNVNEGFSGGERKRFEMLQLLLLKPKLVVLDEIDSGLDLSGVEILSQIVDDLSKEGTSFLIISHNNKLIEKLGIKKTWMTTS